MGRPPAGPVTSRLVLRPAAAADYRRLAAGDRAGLAASLGFAVPEDFPVAAEAVPWFAETLAADPALEGWLVFWALRRCDGVLIGDAGFFGWPDAEGRVELGYAVLSVHRRRGYASEMVAALTALAFSRPGVRSLAARTAVDNPASQAVLRRLGWLAGPPFASDEGMLIPWRSDKPGEGRA